MVQLTDTGYDILRDAVTIARNEQIGTVAQLKQRLTQRWPDAVSEIGAVIQYWANQAQVSSGKR